MTFCWCIIKVFWLTDWKYKYYIDPALSLLLVLLILKSVWPLLKDSALILLQTVPTHIQVDAIQERLLQNVDGVLAVHEFHVWQLAGDRIIASAHIRWVNLRINPALMSNWITLYIDVGTYLSTWKLRKKWRNSFTMRASTPPLFSPSSLTIRTFPLPQSKLV